MKKMYANEWLVAVVTGTFFMMNSIAAAADRVVVIPLGSNRVPAPVRKTGQTKCTYYDGSDWQWDNDCSSTNRPPGQDSELRPGVAWPTPRFTDNGNGTVIDNLTGLIWLQLANCAAPMNWTDALNFAANLYDGWTGDGSGGDCDLSDSSAVGAWRVATIDELLSIMHRNYYDPALSNAAGDDKWTTDEDAFSGVQSDRYWSSTPSAIEVSQAWFVDLHYGWGGYGNKSLAPFLVWPVRGGQ